MTWPVMTLGDVAQWGSGGTPSRSEPTYFGEGTPWVSIADLNDGVVVEAKESLTLDGMQNSSAKLVPAGSLLVAMYGSIGKLGVAGVDLCTSQAIAFALPDPDLLEPQYLFHYLLAQRPLLQHIGRGGTQMNIGQGDLKGWPIPVPPLGEQRRIAEILDQADALLAKRRQSLALLELLKASLVVTTNTNGARAVPLGELANVQGGLQVTARRDALPLRAPYLRVANVHRDRLELEEIKLMGVTEAEFGRTRLVEGDLLLVEGHGNRDEVGRCAVWQAEQDGVVHQNHLIRARVDRSRIFPEIAACMVNGPLARRHLASRAKTTSGLNTINISDVRSIPITLMPTDDQVALVERLRALGERRVALIDSLRAHEELCHSLGQRAFAGLL